MLRLKTLRLHCRARLRATVQCQRADFAAFATAAKRSNSRPKRIERDRGFGDASAPIPIEAPSSSEDNLRLNWFPGHMRTAIAELMPRIQQAQVILEVRDARVPLSSANHLLLDLIKNKRHIIVFNKIDLAHPSTKQILMRFHKQRGEQAVFVNCLKPSTAKQALEAIKSVVQTKFKTVPAACLCIGFPNVGKSSLINSLRKCALNKGKHVAKTGPLPGVTRRLNGFIVSEEPYVMVVDTPGITLPNFAAPDTLLGDELDRLHSLDPQLAAQRDSAFKLAVVGSIKDSIVGEKPLAAFLLRQLNEAQAREVERGNTESETAPGRPSYVRAFGLSAPTDDVDVLLRAVARLFGGGAGVDRNGAPAALSAADADRAARLFLQKFRLGALGRFTLDDLRSLR